MHSLFFLFLLILASGQIAQAQQQVKIPRIGWLTAGSLSASSDRVEAFRQGLRELGYIEGKNIIIEWRTPEGKPDRMRTLAAELVRLRSMLSSRVVREQPVPSRRRLLRFRL
jgi:putative tryptophan/tyrosine transport system substrate-binding protein